MMKKSVTREPSNLLKWVEERMRLRRELEEQKKKQHKNNESQGSFVDMPYLPEDSVFNIIIRLPLETLLASRCVCKGWYGIVKRRDFVNAHLKRSNTGLIYMTAIKGRSSSDVGKEASSSAMKNEFNVDAKVLELDSNPALPWNFFNKRTRFQIKYLEIEDGKSTIKDYNVTSTGQIKAACNGLIVLENLAKGNGLIVMNPVTRELKTIPFGTICSPRHESYGLAFCHESSRYKLVHLFQDGSQYISCEIMNIGGGPWRLVDGPPHGLMSRLGSKPVSAIGALHWVPRIDRNEYIVSMPLKDEKFLQIPLPETGGLHDRVLEIGGVLGFVSRKSAYRMDVWILKSLGGDGWAKQHTIVSDCVRKMVPLYCVGGGGELVFKNENELYAYDQNLQLVRKIEVKNEWNSSPGCYFPHVNSLVSSRIEQRRMKIEPSRMA